MIPTDSISRIVDIVIRVAACLSFFAIILGLSGPYKGGHWIKKPGTGAQIVLLLDRSASMNQNFSGKHMGGRSSETKGRYAQKLLSEFVEQRENDLFAMVSFSTSPIYTLPLTQDKTAILAALRAASMKGRGITNIASGLAMALKFFDHQSHSGSRIILLVSDGATRIDEDTQHALHQWFYENRVTLYWIYMRSPNSSHLSEQPNNPTETTSPEFFLHQFFRNMAIPYRSYEAENPQAVKQAISDISALETKPIVYQEKVAKTDLANYCYGFASILLSLLLISKALETSLWKE